MDTLEGMRTFIAVARQKSFTSGAKQLGISTKLASKYIGQLEKKHDALLFHRTTRSVTLTETGRAYFERCVPLLEQFDELEDVIQHRQSALSGTIRLTAPTAFGSTKLVDALAPFLKQHPDISVELSLSDQRVAIIDEGVDVAIRFGDLQDSTLIAKKLMNMRVVVFASPEYLAQKGAPSHPNALATHHCLLQKSQVDPLNWKFKENGLTFNVNVHGVFASNSPRAVTQMAAQGLGIGMGPIYVTEPYVKEGSLQILFEEFEANQLTLSAVYASNRHLPARIRALLDHLASMFSQQQCF
ncbi:transcriptional regulator, LysR family [Paraglaciecola sp. T6c]|uniref:LysR family transcriptional regulator n=1 Tax=Pseudoalteromonas atlantica (strain T6c / ATCC BAA-1087) TaxID=3042615 RepID=UPI00005C735C|nr:LysR family transcriptional regulator [Paraglaciecola sp. T6c]ABG39655.1 transcriptional regulator, LysR family [Paraglaciecola sp. T6c]